MGICLLGVLTTTCGSGDTATTIATTVPSTVTTVSPATTSQTISTVATTTPLSTTTSQATATTTAPPRTTTTWPQEPAQLVGRVETTERVVALTFDAGSDRGYAEQILDLLADEGIQAGFGLTGKWAEANPDLVRRMSDSGHTLINHTYDHPHMETLSTAERISELDETESIVYAITAASTKPYFRPPFGSYDQQVLVDVGSLGYRFAIMWTVDSLGWKGIPPDQIVERCIDGAAPGAIFLLHVGSASTDYDALPELITQLRDAGYGFATLSELLP